MENRGYNTISLAMIVGVSALTVKRWVNGTYEPRFRNVSRIADTLDVSADYLHGRA
jgi:transcriptional regulator with XRE-family HTH domain